MNILNIYNMKRNKFLLIVAIGMFLASCGGGSQGKPDFSDNEYVVREIKPQATTLEAVYPAILKGEQDVEIRPKVSGFITKLCVKEGQQVREGQVLFIVDNVTFAAAARQAKAAVESAKAGLKTAELTYNNSKKLYDKGVIGDYELSSVENNYASAKAGLAQAEANYTSAEQNLQFCFVKSPANGVIGDLPYRVGALVGPSMQTPFTMVSSINKIEAYFSLNEKDILDMMRTDGTLAKSIEEFPAVKLKLADGTIYGEEGKISAISGVINRTTGTASVRADFANEGHLLKAGGSAQIIIPNTHAKALMLPQKALAQVQNKHFVYKVNGNKVQYTEVSINPENDGHNYIITSGLKTGDKVVIDGIASLRDGMEIKAITESDYDKKLEKTRELGKSQNDAKKLKEALSK